MANRLGEELAIKYTATSPGWENTVQSIKAINGGEAAIQVSTWYLDPFPRKYNDGTQVIWERTPRSSETDGSKLSDI